jgi:5-methylcytosine-specific restriction protein B
VSGTDYRYLDKATLQSALNDLRGTADHLLKIWLTLKHMGLEAGSAVSIDTANSTPSLKELFDFGDRDGRFYIPFAHTKRYLTMAQDASRSIIQTNIRRWATSRSVVTVDPTNYLSITEDSGGQLKVATGRSYPEGLGFGKHGFALDEAARVRIPLRAFAIWLLRTAPLPAEGDLDEHLIDTLQATLRLTSAERQLIFVDDPEREVTTARTPLTADDIHRICQSIIDGAEITQNLVHQTHENYIVEVRSMTTPSFGRPNWLSTDPADLLKCALTDGAKAVLLYGPPRTGKTRFLEQLFESKNGVKIQIHDGWGYDELVIGLKPTGNGGWDFKSGPLLTAIRRGVEFVILEEINRTDFAQAIGEVFSLVEEAYRGKEHSIRLQDGSDLSIPPDMVFCFTMNTLDRSTENIDDALFGRMAAIEFPPRVEMLSEMLERAGVPNAQNWREFFAAVQQYHPMGHGYFAPLSRDTDPCAFYRTRIRPVLQKHLAGYRDDDLRTLDDKFDSMFG